MRISSLALGASLMALLTAPAAAQCGPGAGGPVPPTGSGSTGGNWGANLPTANFVSSTAVLPAGATSIDSIKLNGFQHTWAGDLQILLEDPNGDKHTIVTRVQYLNTSGFGVNCDYDGGDYTFVESGGTGTWPTSSTDCPTGFIAADTYDQYFGSPCCDEWPNGVAGVFNTPMSSIPVVPGGTYTLIINDWAGGDQGFLNDWEICSGGGPSCIGTNYECPSTVANSSGNAATVCASGSLVATDNNVTLTTSGMPTLSSTFGYFLNSQLQNAAGFNPPGSQGQLCVGPTGIGRYNGSVFNASGTGMGSLVLDLTMTPIPSGTTAVQAGDTWYFTTWFRDSNPGSTSNFSDGVCITFQ